MPDSLDPVEAIFEGFTSPILRLFSFFGVSGGAFFLGTNIASLPSVLTSLPKFGPTFIQDVLKSFDGSFPIRWAFMMMHSMAMGWLLPFCGLWVYLLVKLWKDAADLFQILFWLTLSHALHAFIYQMIVTPPASVETGIILSVLMLVCEGSIAGLLLWWKHVKENAPERLEESEPEL
jgi:hypothetical protein